MTIPILATWNTCGQSPVEQEIVQYVKPGEIVKLSGLKIQQLIQLKNQTKFKDTPDLVVPLHPNKKYNMYYNFHPTSGYHTTFEWENGSAKPVIHRPKGGVLCAFWSEVIIFEDNNVVAFPKN